MCRKGWKQLCTELTFRRDGPKWSRSGYICHLRQWVTLPNEMGVYYRPNYVNHVIRASLGTHHFALHFEKIIKMWNARPLGPLHFTYTVNTRYRHTLGTPKKCACNVIVYVTRESRYRHICQGPWGRCACNEGISKFCSQRSWTSSAMSLKKKSPWNIVLFANWSLNTYNGIICTRL